MEHRARWLGVADDGSSVSVEVPSGQSGLLEDRWPPIGLRHVEHTETPPDLRLAVSSDPATGAALAWVEGRTSFGGWDRIESDLALFAAERLAGLVAVHAAVIEKDGRSALIPGASGVGKSTLCVAAARAGLTIVTDEYALVDPTTGRFTGWQRPVRVRRPSGGVDRLPLTVHLPPLSATVVAVLRYGPTDGDASWSPLSPAETVLELLANTVCARSRPDESLDAAMRIAEAAVAVRGARGEADQAIDELLRLMLRA